MRDVVSALIGALAVSGCVGAGPESSGPDIVADTSPADASSSGAEVVGSGGSDAASDDGVLHDAEPRYDGDGASWADSAADGGAELRVPDAQGGDAVLDDSWTLPDGLFNPGDGLDLGSGCGVPPEGGIGPDFDSGFVITVTGGVDPDSLTYSGPGYPTTLPPVEQPSLSIAGGGLYECDQGGVVPTGGNVPGPCLVASYDVGDGSFTGLSALGYDCNLDKRVRQSWGPVPDGSGFWHRVENQFDWTSSNLPEREETWFSAYAFWDPSHGLELWKYDESDRVVWTYYRSDHPADGSHLEITTDYAYVVSATGLVTQETGVETKVFNGYCTTDVWTLDYQYSESGELERLEQWSVNPVTGGQHLVGVINYQYDESGQLERKEGWIGDPQTGELHLEWVVTYLYDELGRPIEIQDTDGEGQFIWRNRFVYFAGGSVNRADSSDIYGIEFEPEWEETHDLDGRLVLSRWDMGPFQGYTSAQCPYGPCWGQSHDVSVYSYNDSGSPVSNIGYLSDWDYVEGSAPESVALWEYDEFGRKTGYARWRIDPVEQVYQLLELTTQHYDCWDEGTAPAAEWAP